MNKYFFLTLLFFNQLTPLEKPQTITASIQSSLQYYLEPADPFKEHTQDLLFNIICNLKDTVFPVLSLDPKAICSFPFINICINLFNASYPNTFLQPLYKYNVNIASRSTFNWCNMIVPIPKNVELAVCKTLFALAIPLIAHYNNPELFIRHTYLTVYDLGTDYLTVLFPYAYIIFKKYSKGFSSLVHPIECIFEAKQIMFFILTVLACCKIKLKNTKFLTNPTYWLPIGILHALYVNKKLACLILNQKNVWCLPDKLKNSYNKNLIGDQLLSYGCTYIIPITAVLVSALVPDLTK